jgi:choline dehydrogenase-like flavoprotein
MAELPEENPSVRSVFLFNVQTGGGHMAQQQAPSTFDAIVVGSGPGGATVTRELARAGKNVLLLEWGGRPEIRGSFIQLASMVRRPGRGVLFTPDGIALFRNITTGGSSMSYYATAWEPPVEALKRFGIDVSRELEEIRSELPINVLPDELIGPFARRITDSARDLGYDWDKFRKFVYLEKCRPDCDKCIYGCPYGAKWTSRMFAEEATVLGGTTLINGARVGRVLVDRGKAIGVEFQMMGKAQRVWAPQIILSAGGIGSPVILRASGIRAAGQDFFFDPLIGVFGTVKGIKGGREFPMATGCHFEEEGYILSDYNLPAPLYMAFVCEVLRFDRLFSHSRTLQIMVKARDPLGGRLTDKGAVRKRLSAEDKGRLLHGCDRAKRILKHAGAKNIFKTWYIAAHPGGTVKIGDLVDSNLRTEIENLYVCDCSVIPSAWGLPPVFTILCLAKRLARHLTQ